MLTHPTLEQMRALKLDGMAEAFIELEAQDRAKDLSHAEWLALLLDRETASRSTRRFQVRLKSARLRHSQASVEDVDYRASRRLDKALFQQLATCRWIAEHRSLLVTGPCGVGKSWLSCALAKKASRDGYTVHYARVPRLFAELELAHGDGRFAKLFRTLTRSDLLILDDWGPDRLTAPQRRDLMEIVEDRYGRGSTLITSQLPVDKWHDVIDEPTFADAILDRLVHNAYRLALDLRFPKPTALSRSTSRTLRMGNLCCDIPRSLLQRGRRLCRPQDHPTVPLTPSTGWVATPVRGSPSIGTVGRHASE
jgi:DNA replication protein DnaC